MLVKDSIDEFKRREIKTVCSIAWKSKYRTNIGGILKRLGFEQILEIQNYWKEDSIEKGYSCPVCGGPPCKCSAVIYNLIA